MAFRGLADFLYLNFFSLPFPSNSSIYLFFLLRVLSLLFHQIIVLFPLLCNSFRCISSCATYSLVQIDIPMAHSTTLSHSIY